MGVEIERKFLVNLKDFKTLQSLHLPMRPKYITQGYLSSDPERTVRIRMIDDEAYITIKGKRIGNSCPEFEYRIPVEDGGELIKLCSNVLSKTRYHLGRWEIDVFSKDNTGLIIAEIEMSSEDEKFEIPWWVGKEVSDNDLYFNSSLARRPWAKWPVNSRNSQ